MRGVVSGCDAGCDAGPSPAAPAPASHPAPLSPQTLLPPTSVFGTFPLSLSTFFPLSMSTCLSHPFLLSPVTDDPGQFAGSRAQFDLTSRWALRGAFLDTVKNIYNRKYCYKYTHQKQRTEEASLVTGTHCSSHQRSWPRACVGPSDSDWIASPAVIPLPLCL
jgi:hypothetical protein